jgi:hypothetical protein
MNQVRIDDTKVIEYYFGDDSVTAKYKGITDEFDFSQFKNDGEVDVFSVETTLPFNPIISAVRTDGVLHLQLINFVSYDEENMIPDWIEV